MPTIFSSDFLFVKSTVQLDHANSYPHITNVQLYMALEVTYYPLGAVGGLMIMNKVEVTDKLSLWFRKKGAFLQKTL